MMIFLYNLSVRDRNTLLRQTAEYFSRNKMVFVAAGNSDVAMERGTTYRDITLQALPNDC